MPPRQLPMNEVSFVVSISSIYPCTEYDKLARLLSIRVMESHG
jgi:hypothetical protein